MLVTVVNFLSTVEAQFSTHSRSCRPLTSDLGQAWLSFSLSASSYPMVVLEDLPLSREGDGV